MRNGMNRSLYLSIRMAIKQIVVNIETYHYCQLHTQFYPTPCGENELQMKRKFGGVVNVDFDATHQQLIIYSAFFKYFRKSGNKRDSVSADYSLQESL